MTVQKKILDLTGTQYLVQKITGEIPVKISDLQDDVALGTHIADTDKHVTTADKNRWNNQTYVLRYCSTTLVASSTNSNSLLDNTDNLKVGDKVIDNTGNIYVVTAIDTANSTFTIGASLIDLAQDSDVVHKSGNETISGEKTFQQRPIIFNSNATVQADVPNLMFKNPLVERASTTLDGEQTILFTDKNASNIASIQAKTYTSGTSDIILTSYSETSEQAVRTTGIVIRRTPTTSKFQGYSDNITSLGDTNRRWSKVYAMNYYYGNDNVEFSNKFVTTDTAQTVSGSKTFSDNLTIYNSDDTQTPKGLAIRNAQWVMGESSGTTTSNIKFLDKNSAIPACITASKGLYGQSFLRFSVRTKDSQNTTLTEEIYYDVDTSGNVEFRSWHDNITRLGTSLYKWKDVQTYQINGLEPSSLSLPSGNANDVIDISSYITALDGSSNSYTVPANGWISIAVVGIAIAIVSSSWSDSRFRSGSGNVRMLYPVLKNETLDILITGTTLAYARFIPCQGNV